MSNKQLEKEWQYKDASRYYWRIKIWKTDEQPCWQGSEQIDFIWGYKIERSDSGESNWQKIYFNEIQGQYDIIPDLSEILLDFHNYISCFIVGASMYQDDIEVLNEKEA